MNCPTRPIPNTPHLDREQRARVQSKPAETKTGYVDGAWWPHSTDLAAELPHLITAIAGRLDSIHRVVYQPGEWTHTPQQLTDAGRTVRLDGNRHGTAHTIEILGARDRRQIFLIIPPHTDPHRAGAVMAAACRVDDESTVDQLLAQLPGRTGRAAALRQWRSSGTSRRIDTPANAHRLHGGAPSPTP
ncbi:hypothetical protein C5E45_21720 [Nocardia nova]|uniref:Uncharacterized protein n=1 Tax=Nocardia nova TaxID=37330 RepID=A0A2S6ALD5_9NOCA|nr:DUF5994 family protein [Nocardia nova]PPJ36038.1 hypothetical protein C5E45_21720 [Nocardia nova]